MHNKLLKVWLIYYDKIKYIFTNGFQRWRNMQKLVLKIVMFRRINVI